MLLADRVMRKEAKRHSIDLVGFSSATIDALLGYSWPQDVVELRDAVTSAVETFATETHHGRKHLLPVTSLSPEIQLTLEGSASRIEQPSTQNADELLDRVGRAHPRPHRYLRGGNPSALTQERELPHLDDSVS